MMKAVIGFALLALLCGNSALHAATATSEGEDLNPSPGTRLENTPNSDAAKSDFLSNLPSGSVTDVIDFEGLPVGALPVDGIAILLPGNGINMEFTSSGATIINLPTGVTPSTGGYSGKQYPTSGDQFLGVNVTTGTLTLTFDNPVRAFGFSGIDVGDSGDLFLTLTDTNGFEELLNVPHTVTPGPTGLVADGNVIFFGFVADEGSAIDKIVFDNSLGSVDYIGLDDFIVAAVVPIPAAFLFLGSAVIGLPVFFGRRRRTT